MTEQQPPQSDPSQPSTPGQPPAYPAFPAQAGQVLPPPPGQYPPYNPYGPTAGPASKALAITALVLSIFGIAIVTAIAAIVLAIIVLVRSKDGRSHGKGMAITALVFSGLWILFWILAVVGTIADQADRDSEGKVTTSGKTSITSLRTGDCVVDTPEAGKKVYRVEVTPCSKPHRLEAYATFDLAAGDFPGKDAVAGLAEDGCLDRFEGFVGTKPEDSELGVFYIQPLESSWGADRGVTCFVIPGEDVTSSLKNSRR